MVTALRRLIPNSERVRTLCSSSKSRRATVGGSELRIATQLAHARPNPRQLLVCSLLISPDGAAYLGGQVTALSPRQQECIKIVHPYSLAAQHAKHLRFCLERYCIRFGLIHYPLKCAQLLYGWPDLRITLQQTHLRV